MSIGIWRDPTVLYVTVVDGLIDAILVTEVLRREADVLVLKLKLTLSC